MFHLWVFIKATLTLVGFPTISHLADEGFGIGVLRLVSLEVNHACSTTLMKTHNLLLASWGEKGEGGREKQMEDGEEVTCNIMPCCVLN